MLILPSQSAPKFLSDDHKCHPAGSISEKYTFLILTSHS